MSARPALGVVCLLSVLAGACGSGTAPARGQWKVLLSTDAPVPQFGDQIVVDVLEVGTSPQRRLFDASTPDRWPISFGVVPTDPQAPVSVRARFFRTATTGADGLPTSVAIIDETGTLPPIQGVTQVSFVLGMSCFGVGPSADGSKSCDPANGTLDPPKVLPVVPDESTLAVPGSWAPARTVDCNGAVPQGMTCAKGGAFLLGSPRYYPTGTILDPTPEHVVQLSPFAIDLREVRVGQIRPLVAQGRLPPPLQKASDPMALGGLCTYLGPNDATNDDMPVNCVAWQDAKQACSLLGGKRLPTEAEWEYAARNMALESQFPWGSNSDVCAFAVVARGRPFVSGSMMTEPTDCSVANGMTFAPGPVAETTTANADVSTALHLLFMAGNVDEWVDDVFAAYDEPCWQAGRLLVDPDCQQGASGPSQHSARGGAFNLLPYLAGAFYRDVNDTPSEATGFRCAKSM